MTAEKKKAKGRPRVAPELLKSNAPYKPTGRPRGRPKGTGMTAEQKALAAAKRTRLREARAAYEGFTRANPYCPNEYQGLIRWYGQHLCRLHAVLGNRRAYVMGRAESNKLRAFMRKNPLLAALNPLWELFLHSEEHPHFCGLATEGLYAERLLASGMGSLLKRFSAKRCLFPGIYINQPIYGEVVSSTFYEFTGTPDNIRMILDRFKEKPARVMAYYPDNSQASWDLHRVLIEHEVPYLMAPNRFAPGPGNMPLPRDEPEKGTVGIWTPDTQIPPFLA